MKCPICGEDGLEPSQLRDHYYCKKCHKNMPKKWVGKDYSFLKGRK